MNKQYIKIGSFILTIFILVLTFIVFRPFILSIIGAAIIAYLVHPIYNYFHRITKRKNFSTVIILTLIFLLVVLPFLVIINTVIKEAPAIYLWVSDALQNSNLWSDYDQISVNFGLRFELKGFVESLTTSIIQVSHSMLKSIPTKILSFSVGAFFLFFFIRDGYSIFRMAVYYLPLTKKDSIIVIRELKEMTDAVLYGQIVTALVQALLATGAYYLLGIRAPLVWGILTLFFALIPLLGPPIIYIPLAFTLIIPGINLGNSTLLFKGIFLFIFGVGVVSTVDNFIKPLVISGKTKVHPALTFLGIVGGITSFGLIGIVLGPLIIILIITMFDLFRMKENISEHLEHQRKV